MRARIAALRAASARSAIVLSVAIYRGAIAFTCTLRPAHSLASALVNCATPPFAAAYPGTVMPPWKLNSDAVNTIFPAPRSSMPRPNSRASTNCALKSISMILSQYSSGCSAAGLRRIVPPLLIRISTGGHSAFTFSTNPYTAGRSARSHAYGQHWRSLPALVATISAPDCQPGMARYIAAYRCPQGTSTSLWRQSGPGGIAADSVAGTYLGPISSRPSASQHLMARSSILGACKHTGERLQSVSMANLFWRAFHLSPASRWKCWCSREPRDQRRPGAEAFETRFSSSVSRWSLLPARTGTPCGDVCWTPAFGSGGFLGRIGCNRGTANFSNLARTESSALASSHVGKLPNWCNTEG